MRSKPIDVTSYEPKKKLKKYHKFLIAGAAITGLSFLLTLVPCKISDSKISTLGFCKLPNPFTNLQTTTHYYYTLSNNPISGLFLQLIVSILLAYLVAYGFKKLNLKRKNHKIVDFTKKDR